MNGGVIAFYVGQEITPTNCTSITSYVFSFSKQFPEGFEGLQDKYRTRQQKGKVEMTCNSDTDKNASSTSLTAQTFK